jgi:hypothetical protein
MDINDLFQVVPLTQAVNKIPVPPGTLGAMGLFAERGIRTTSVAVELSAGRLVLVPNKSREGDPTPYGSGKRNVKTLTATHLPLSGVVLPNEIQDVRAFGSESVEAGLQSQATVINDKLAAMKASLEATREWHRIGALRGQVLDADGSVILDLYDTFGVTKKTASIAFSTATTNVLKACLDAKRHAESKLGGVSVRGFRAFASAGFYDALVDHPKTREAFANWQAAQDRLGGDMRRGFPFGGIEFIELPDAVGNTKFIPANTAVVFPVAQGVFETLSAPANYNEAANTIGQPYYAKAEQRKMGKGWDLEVQANPLTIGLYPEAIVELTAT